MTSEPEAVPSDPVVDIAIVDPEWSGLISDIEPLCLRAIMATQIELDTVPEGEISIAFVDNARIAQLNETYRRKSGPTNVLSFPADGHNPALGDIVIAREICQEEARAKAIEICDHIAHLCIHGFLHLCGYDHETIGEAEVMEAIEIRALAGLGVANPYEDTHV